MGTEGKREARLKACREGEVGAGMTLRPSSGEQQNIGFANHAIQPHRLCVVYNG